ncbi:helix-turn-helix transcriptional regulator [Streptomyces sp. NRRL WC-3742]|uniref:helix-turn-helix transcriptional regulator n=1 Tax=Streptomyces sp. NRRL WC-3742 TaxID=1463934 RepID=UPI0004C80C8F|nr:LuxR family transcriptional regulator [Streptomyces sp. NRRL WC-3742]
MPTGTLLHRERELAELARTLAGTQAGRPAVVLVRGPRGIGRSALLAAALARVDGGAVVLRARCHTAEREFPYGVVRQLFDPFPGMWRGVERNESGEFPEQVLDHLFRAARSLTSRTPVVIAVDDLHLADEESRQWFSYLARRLEGLPVALLATTADEAADPLAAELAGLGHARTVTPDPLCDGCVAELLAEEFDTPVDQDLAALCHDLTRGNPLVLEELAARLRAARVPVGAPDLAAVHRIGAATVADTSLTWLRHAHPRAADLLTALAVLGPGADLATAALLTGQGELHAGEAHEALRRTDLVDPGPPAAFRHDTIRAAVLAHTDPATLLALHERAATLLTRLGAPATRTAEHLLSAGTTHPDRSVPVLRAAAREAATDGNWDAAARYLHRALADTLPPDPAHPLTAHLGTVELHRDIPAAIRCATTLTTITDPALRALLLAPLASPVLALGGASAAFAEAATALAAPTAPAAPPVAPPAALPEASADDPTDPAHPSADLLTGGPAVTASFADIAAASFAASAAAGPGPVDVLPVLAAHAVLAGRRAPLRPALAAVRTGAVRTGAVRTGTGRAGAPALFGALAASAAAAGSSRTAGRFAQRCLDAVSPAEAGAEVLGAALALAWTGAPGEAIDWVGRAVRSAERWNRRSDLALALLIRADLAHHRARPQDALADAERAAELGAALSARELTSAAGTLALRSRLALGRPGGPAIAELPAEAHPLLRAVALETRGLLAAHHGDHREALRLFRSCGALLAAYGVTNPACVPWRSHAARANRALGDPAAAQALEAAPAPAAGRPRRQARLSPSERRVVDLVLQGLSNLEVAERLFLSKRTVDTHLGRIYRRLGIKGRPELAEAVKGL